MIDAIFHLGWTLPPWDLFGDRIRQYTVTLLKKPIPPSLNRAILLLSPYTSIFDWDKTMVDKWVVAASAVLYSEEVGRSVVDMLLQLASSDTGRQYIPIDMWAWLEKQPSLHPGCRGRDWGRGRDLVCYVRQFGDLNVLTSYFLLVWSEWVIYGDEGFDEMQASIIKDLSGIGEQHHREDLIRRLDYILGEMDRGLNYFKRYQPWIEEDDIRMGREQHETLRRVLLEVEGKARKILAGMSARVDLFQPVN